MLTHRIGGIRLSPSRSARPETAMTDLRDTSATNACWRPTAIARNWSAG